MSEINKTSMPEVVRSLLYAASVNMSQGQIDDAILLYGKVIEILPNCGEAYYERGRAKHQIGNVRGATDDLMRALQLSPELEKEISGQFRAGTSTCR